MAVVFKNNANTVLASSITSSATSVSVLNGSVFPSLSAGEYFLCTIDDDTNNEIVKVTAISGNTLTVVRAQEGTTARAFANSSTIESRVTAGIMDLFPQLDGGELTADEFIGDFRGSVLFKAQAGEALSKGDAVYISGISGNTTVVSKADADDAAKMPAFGIVAAAASLNNPVDVYTTGILSNIDTSSYSVGDELFVSNTPGSLTDTPPTGESSALQKIAKVTRSDASAGSIFITGAGRSNAVPNLNDGKIFLGNGSNQAVSTTLDTSVVPENTNFYYTDARARSAISVSGNALSYDSGTGVITSNYEESPTFTGNVSILSTYPKLSFADTDNNPDFTIIGGSGQFGIYDETNATYRFQIDSSGNITVSGTVDGRDLATDGTKLDGIESGATADQTQAEINALGITATGLSGTPNITVGTISSGAITSTGAITSSDFFKATGGNLKFSAGGNHIFNVDLNGKIYPQTHNAVDLGFSSSLAFRNLYLSGTISSGAITSTGTITSPKFYNTGNTYIDSGYSEIHLQGSGTTFGKLYTSGGDFYINNPTQDEDIIFSGNDGGSAITALILDMSEAGYATFNNNVRAASFSVGAGPTSELLFLSGAGHNGHGTTNARSVASFNVTGQSAGLWFGARNDETTGIIGTRTATGNLAFETYNSGWGERMRITYDGDVGIGTDNPSAKLDVDGSAKATTFSASNSITIDNSSGYAAMEMGGSSGAYIDLKNPSSDDYDLRLITFGSGGQILAAAGSPILLASDGNSNQLYLTSSGAVGIGTNNPSAKLDVNGIINIKSNPIVDSDGTSHYLKTPSGGAMYFYHGTTNMMYYSSSALLPGADDARDLGSTSLRWRNVYTTDLHLSNEGKSGGNEVDGTTGNWTIQEGKDHLYIINNKNGKKYRFALEEIE